MVTISVLPQYHKPVNFKYSSRCDLKRHHHDSSSEDKWLVNHRYLSILTMSYSLSLLHNVIHFPSNYSKGHETTIRETLHFVTMPKAASDNTGWSIYLLRYPNGIDQSQLY